MPKLVCTQICVLSDGVCAYVGATKSGSRYSAISTTCRHSHEDAKRGEEDIVARYHETVVQSSAGPSRVGPEAEHGADQHAIFVQ